MIVGDIRRDPDSLKVNQSTTPKGSVTVTLWGILPDLFREQGGGAGHPEEHNHIRRTRGAGNMTNYAAEVEEGDAGKAARALVDTSSAVLNTTARLYGAGVALLLSVYYRCGAWRR